MDEAITFFIEHFGLTVPKTFVGGALVIQKISALKKNHGSEWGYHLFPLEIFCLLVPKKILGERFCVSEKFSW